MQGTVLSFTRSGGFKVLLNSCTAGLRLPTLIFQVCFLRIVFKPSVKVKVYYKILYCVSVKKLEEENYYSFEVIATSINDEILVSERVTIEVPAYRRNRAISMGIVTGIGFLATTLGVIWWAKKKFCHDPPAEK